MPKRKRHDGDDYGFSIKRRRRGFQHGVSELCQDLYDTIRNYKLEDGRLLCEAFIRVPKRRNSADYYDIVSTPIDLLKIQQKLKTDGYDDLEQMANDVELIVNNARAYYKKNSQEYKDACQLWDVFVARRSRLLNFSASKVKEDYDYDDDENSNSNTGHEVSRFQSPVNVQGDEENHYEELFAAVMTASDLDGRVYSTSVQLLPSQRRNPDYYKFIQEPMDLKMIATNIQYCKYQNLNELEHDLLLVVKNARIYYPPGSQTYKDAGALRRVIVNKKLEIEHGRATGSKTSERIRQRRLAGGQRLSAITAALQYESEGDGSDADEGGKDPHEEDDDDEDDDEDSESDGGNDISGEGKRNSRGDSRTFKRSSRLQKAGSASARKTKLGKSNESDDDDEEATEEKTSQRRRGRRPLEERRRGRPRLIPEVDPGMKKRMRILYRTIFEYTDEAGRPLITFFLEKPSKKNYPDYYQIIAEPIDMKTIEVNIKNDKYDSEEALLSDFQLMFRNCRQYNEENSQIFRDAVTLEKVLMDKVQELATDSPKLKIIAKKSKVKASPQVTQKLRTLYETIKEYNDKGRKLSVIFSKLPSKSEYPDYYEVIKRPVDMQKIWNRFNSGHYEGLEDMLSDFVQMFDNACKYNEPDSQIYKDALTLQRVALQCKMELSEDEDGSIPDVRPLVQELLTSLFTYVYNHQDEEGRCYSDSLAELSESGPDDQEPVKILTLDLIKKNLDKGRYKRLDSFQEHMFEVFETARRMSRTDSQVFEDSIELQSYFIKMREELCKNGDVLSSPANRFNERDMQAGVETLRLEKLPKEKTEDERDKEQDKVDKYLRLQEHRTTQNNSDSCSYREQTYRIGDYVYIEPREKGLDAHIIHIDKLWKDENGEQWLYGCWFYRPNETFHLTTRKFLEKEVFKSDCCNSTPMNQVLGKCYVMNVKDYFKYKPEGFQDKDIYVCESRYSAKAKSFKKIKIWGGSFSSHIRIIPRDAPLTPIRIPSMFKEKMDKPKEESLDWDDVGSRVFEREKPNVVLTSASNDETITFYEQYNIPSGRFKLGDCVLVRSENGRQLIARIDQMWEEKLKGAFFHGPWFVTPQEITHPPTRLFHKQEVFLSSIEDTNPLLSVTGRCYVMELDDYVRCRPTEIPEQDVYVCESRYLEAERQIRKLTKGLKKFLLSPNVTEDEIYYFKKPISTQKSEHCGGAQIATKSKVHTSSEPSPLLPKVSDAEMDDSNDCRTPSVGSNEAVPVAVPASSHRKKGIRRLVTGYILYAGEVRKSIILQHPDSTFGEISRLVGTEWRNLPTEIKNDYEEKALRMNEETAANQSLLESQTSSLIENMVYECHWEKCDAQFEDLHDLIEHVGGETSGHIFLKYQQVLDGGDFKCLWRNCSRIKKSMAPFQSIQRLARHFRDVHVRTCSKIVPPADRGRNFVPSTRGLPSTGNNRPATPVQSCSTPRFSHSLQTGYSGSYENLPGYSNLLNKSGNTPAVTPLNHYPMTGSKTKLKSSPGNKDRMGKTKRSKLKRRNEEMAKKKGNSGFGQEVATKTTDHIFVAVPPKSQRLLHSEAYLRYIEGLQPENKTISNWDNNLKATQENTPLYDSGRLPVHWLANGVGSHGNVVNALWALRDFMLKDSLNISKVI